MYKSPRLIQWPSIQFSSFMADLVPSRGDSTLKQHGGWDEARKVVRRFRRLKPQNGGWTTTTLQQCLRDSKVPDLGTR
jgi:hypothetical protein